MPRTPTRCGSLCCASCPPVSGQPRTSISRRATSSRTSSGRAAFPTDASGAQLRSKNARVGRQGYCPVARGGGRLPGGGWLAGGRVPGGGRGGGGRLTGGRTPGGGRAGGGRNTGGGGRGRYIGGGTPCGKRLQ